MPDFAYTARNSSGQRVTGTLSAASRRDALSTLAGRSLFPVEVKGATPAASKPQGGVRRVPAQVRSATFSQLADLLQSGVPLLRSLDVLRRQNRHRGMAIVLDEVRERVEDGETLSTAMARFPRVFGEMPISMVRAGTEGGFLEDALSRVAQFIEAQDDLRKRTVGALAYPVFLASAMTLVVVVLMVFFVPMFDNLFDDLDRRGQLPAITKVILGTSTALRDYGLFVLGGLVATGVAAYYRLQRPDGRLLLDRLRLGLPLVGRVVQNLAVARFCRVLGTLLQNGVPILKSLEISSSATGNEVLASAITHASDNISAGEALAEPLEKSGRFPPAVVEMIAVAEESNTLERVLLNIAESLERQTFRQLDLAIKLLEPVMLVMIAGIMLLLAIGLLLPVLTMGKVI